MIMITFCNNTVHVYLTATTYAAMKSEQEAEARERKQAAREAAIRSELLDYLHEIDRELTEATDAEERAKLLTTRSDIIKDLYGSRL